MPTLISSTGAPPLYFKMFELCQINIFFATLMSFPSN
jgi:hypothetical protein